LYRGGQSYKKPRFDYGLRRPIKVERHERILVRDRLGGRPSVHDQLGGRIMLPDPSGGQNPTHDRLEQMTDDRMPDDQSMRKDLEREQFARRAGQPQWCPVGLNKSQKRRVQRLRQSEILEEEQK